MNRLTTALAAAAALALTAVPGRAADVPMVVPVAPPVVVAPVSVAYDWSGLYVGAYAGYQNMIPPPYAVGAQAGFNFQRGKLVFGVQARAGTYLPLAPHFNVEGRAGLALGSTGRILAYAVGGVGFIPCCAPVHFEVGAGVEIAVGERLSVFGEARTFLPLSPAGALALRGGVNVHF